MAIGFDFGTSNCSVAHIVDDNVVPIPLVDNEFYITSTLSAPNRESVTEHLYRYQNISPINDIGTQLLRSSMNLNKAQGIDVLLDDLKFGVEATSLYLSDPTEVYYVKSPKSFLGLLGLREVQLAIFEDLVCAMMANIKFNVESQLEESIDEAVIGRPINFHLRGDDESNRQGQNILHRAATRAGFKSVEFQYEPVAAGLEYESTLTSDKNVLVVDVGGGTSDCSLIRMGPSWVGKQQRSETLLAQSGMFTGGNDMDIYIAFKKFMLEFGKGTSRSSRLQIPTMTFWEPVAINDIEAQRRFYKHDNLRELKKLLSESNSPEKIARLISVYENTLGHSMVGEAEKTKIALSTNESYTAVIDLLTEEVNIPVSLEQMKDATAAPVQKIAKLVQETLTQAETKPDVIFITGGSARSPIIREAVKSVVKDIPFVNGDYFGSVTAGLARWANVCFR